MDQRFAARFFLARNFLETRPVKAGRVFSCAIHFMDIRCQSGKSKGGNMSVNGGQTVGLENRRRVYAFLKENLGHSAKECATSLGISEKAVGRHVKAIRDGWRPETEATSP